MRSCKVIASRHNATKTLEFNEIEENSPALQRYLKTTLLKKHTEEQTHFQKQKRKHHYSSMHVEVWDIYKTA